MLTSSALLFLSLAVCCATSVEYMLPMRDGVLLHTVVDFPAGVDPNSGRNASTVLERSPYGAYASELIADVFATLTSLFGPVPHVAVRQDIRGTGQSGGTFGIWHDSANDSFDTLEWISTQGWSNGQVFTTGASADGLDELAAITGPHPARRAQFVVFAGSTGHEIAYPGGAYRKQLIEHWLNDTVPVHAERSIAMVQENETPGPWWDCLNGTLFYPKVDWPTVQWGGWYDIFLAPQLAAYSGFQFESGAGARGRQRIFIDALGHCQEASGYVPPRSIFGRSIAPILMALDMLYSGDSNMTVEGLNVVTFYVVGSITGDNTTLTSGNYWTTMAEWPTFAPTKYYFASSGGKRVGNLTTQQPSQHSQVGYIYDPANPVPTLGGNNLFGSCGPADQSSVEASYRSDVLTFTSHVLQAPVALTGPLIADLYVSSNCTDTDFTVKLVDVDPAGHAAIVQDGIVRMRWRDAPTGSWNPSPMVPGKVYHVEVSLWNTSKIFDVNHRIRVDVSSSNYPRFGANPNNGLAIVDSGPVYIANNVLHTGGEYASSIILPVVNIAQLPPIDLLEQSEQLFHAMQQRGRLNPSASWEQFLDLTPRFDTSLQARLSAAAVQRRP